MGVGKRLIIADIHIGIEHKFYNAGMKIPSQTKALLHEIETIADEHGFKNIIFLGDVKEKVPGTSFQEMRELPDFFSHLSDIAKVDVIIGNHDTGLDAIISKNARFHKSMKIGKIFLAHGHIWPERDMLNSRTVIIGHEHPQIEFSDVMGYHFTERAWVRANLSWNKIKSHYRLKERTKLPRLIIMPAFNRFCGGLRMNRQYAKTKRPDGTVGLGPIARSADIKNADIYLLDGTYIGKLNSL